MCASCRQHYRKPRDRQKQDRNRLRKQAEAEEHADRYRGRRAWRLLGISCAVPLRLAQVSQEEQHHRGGEHLGQRVITDGRGDGELHGQEGDDSGSGRGHPGVAAREQSAHAEGEVDEREGQHERKEAHGLLAGIAAAREEIGGQGDAVVQGRLVELVVGIGVRGIEYGETAFVGEELDVANVRGLVRPLPQGDACCVGDRDEEVRDGDDPHHPPGEIRPRRPRSLRCRARLGYALALPFLASSHRLSDP